jgi:membrane-associated PAP2 superfamily phosphatase
MAATPLETNRSTYPGDSRRFGSRAFILPCALIWLAVAARLGGLDRWLSDLAFDGASAQFPLRDAWPLELVGHHLARSMVVIVWLGLVGLAAASYGFEALRPCRRILWTTAAAMVLGPLIVVMLKSVTGFPCPWSLKRYGGFAAEATSWFTMPVDAGHCFPAGHSAAGFSFFAFAFAARAIRRPRLAVAAFWVALSLGTLFSAVRVAQGAHFLSHGLWAGAIDWLAAAAVFLPGRNRGVDCAPLSATAGDAR